MHRRVKEMIDSKTRMIACLIWWYSTVLRYKCLLYTLLPCSIFTGIFWILEFASAPNDARCWERKCWGGALNKDPLRRIRLSIIRCLPLIVINSYREQCNFLVFSDYTSLMLGNSSQNECSASASFSRNAIHMTVLITLPLQCGRPHFH